MGDKDFVKPLLESRGTVHFGKVPLHIHRPCYCHPYWSSAGRGGLFTVGIAVNSQCLLHHGVHAGGDKAERWSGAWVPAQA